MKALCIPALLLYLQLFQRAASVPLNDPNMPKYPKAAPKRLSKHYCEQVYAHSDLFSDSKYDGLWDAVDDPARTFRDIAGHVLVEEFEYHAFKQYAAQLKLCLEQSKDAHGRHRKATE
ncbi:hypothetical protein HDU78_007822 [Chytriomyces hyalinus]|nr:hypothetical protein HDU78_007822 [Chytriomyces hyalinus]